MKLAIDGGAFQQGIAAGIFNVGAGLINAIARARPETGFVLVADPRLGPVRQDLLARLSIVPDIVEGEVGPAYGDRRLPFTTTEPDVRFDVDGVVSPAALIDGEVVYEGPAPARSFRILSRAEKPSATSESGDERLLGIKLGRIAIQAGRDLVCVALDHPRIGRGFHHLEGTCRWTNGAAELPKDLFPAEETVKVTLGVVGTVTYRLADGRFDASAARVTGRLERLSLRTAAAQVERELIRRGVTAYLANHFLPVHFPNLTNYAFLHDVLPLLYPEFFMADARENFAHNMAVFRSADHVFSNSEASRKDLIRVGGVAPERVTMISIAIDEAFAPRPSAKVAETRQRYGLASRPYILTVGTIEPRKNHARLVEAFAALSKSGAPACDLALVGKHGWGTDNLFHQIRQLGLEDRVHVLTGVTNEDLPALYAGALFAAYPSLYEGFGLPVLEAMACGCPVLTSNRASMPEIAGDAALLVDPTETGSILQGLYTLLTNGGLRRRLADLGLQRRRGFGWDVTAARFLKVAEAG